ncbi:conserved exported hypothetical protein [Bradyrhizobium sp. ORS 375]|uniref:hypothetical protein n=1 Tax=Bradyrhizobium sp. (strain ORS 375) TaxID=566679 RepID=UPI0002407B3A|nr:hypothetical protein [Bradyrhizobium sp. ORS 375]CCD96426.1 conserved exported hypothetical protein [Bradyrhizobium sp. ORS 375]
MKTPAMKTLAIAMGLLILAADGAVLAQGSSMSGDSTTQGAKKRRQPRPSDLPKAEQADESSMGNMSKEDRELDRKIKSICRGC